MKQLWLFPIRMALNPQYLLALIARKEMEMKKEEEVKKFHSTFYEALSGKGKETLLAVKQEALSSPERKKRGKEAVALSTLFEGAK